ncbi:MAG: restriction endonuclease subunit S, partial [Anaerolineae bacterium]
FPGHEGVEMVEVDGGNGNGNGRVPEGWEIRPFSEIADVLSGGTPKTKVPEYWNGEIPFFSPKDHNGSFFISQTERYITKLGLNKCNSKLYPPNTVFITARGTVGKVIMPSVHMAMNQSCYALQGRDGVHQLYIFLSIMNHVEQLKQRAHGAVFDTIIVDTFSKLEIVKPPPNILNEFVTKVEPIFDLIRNLLDKNANLRQTRDLLLPRLISGELDVSHIPVAEVSLPRSPHTTNTR